MKLKTISIITSALVVTLLQSHYTLAVISINANDVAKALTTPDTSITIGREKYLINRKHCAFGAVMPKSDINAQNITIVNKAWKDGKLQVQYTSNKRYTMILTPITTTPVRR